MKFNKIINYLLVIIGAVVAIYAQADEKQDTTILILGLFCLMLGVYRISRSIPSKSEEEHHEN
ncbi:hypothetical protein [Mangrovimonas yunxiaonensis]|uniref:hypothetical protein n=1 Tax=Mangrovimonas yunxiaonensis TaxID=1197477 RepID=UPI00055A57E8|nr:hypothetical protein [Mangrovimonas yunxiaonensis]GGH47945.1 hypothetical protein GCM10011364_23160 [Mangrovimonas yunxiaonensis]